MTTSALQTLFDQVEYSTTFVVTACIVLIIGLVVICSSLLLLAHHLVTEHQRRVRARYIDQASAFLAPEFLRVDGLPDAVDEARRRWGWEVVARVLREARLHVRGPVGERITEVLEREGEIGRQVRRAEARADWKRAQAVRALGECGGARAREVLLTFIDDPSPEVRRLVRSGLLMDPTPASVAAAISSYLRDAPTRSAWRRSFYARLATVGASSLYTLLAEDTLANEEKKLAIEALGDAGESQSVPYARQLLNDDDAELRATAARVLGKLRDQQSLSLLGDRLSDPEWFVRAAAAKALGSLRCDTARCAALKEKLTDEAWWVRANAARSLASQGKPGVGQLLEALSSSDPYARQAALSALVFAGLDAEDRRRLDGYLKQLPREEARESSMLLKSGLAVEGA